MLKCYICAKGGIIVGMTVHTMLTHLVQLSLKATKYLPLLSLGITDGHGENHWSRCHTPLGHVLQLFGIRPINPFSAELFSRKLHMSAEPGAANGLIRIFIGNAFYLEPG